MTSAQETCLNGMQNALTDKLESHIAEVGRKLERFNHALDQINQCSTHFCEMRLTITVARDGIKLTNSVIFSLLDTIRAFFRCLSVSQPQLFLRERGRG